MKRLVSLLLVLMMLLACLPNLSGAVLAAEGAATVVTEAPAPVEKSPDPETAPAPEPEVQTGEAVLTSAAEDTATEPLQSTAATVVDSGNCGADGDGSNLTWELDSDGVLIISGEGKMEDYYYYYAPWSSHRTEITSVVLPADLSSIGDHAFSECNALSSVDLSSCGSLSSIGYRAFYGCDALSSVDLSACGNLSSIGDSAFRDCDALGSVDLSGCGSLSSIGSSAFSGCDALGSVDLSGCGSLSSIGDYAFSDCDALGSVDLPSSLSSIGDDAFCNCKMLSSVDLSGCGSLTSIGDSAFYGCGALSSVDLSGCGSLSSIGDCAFYRCYALSSVDLSACGNLSSIGSDAFCNCKMLSSVDLSGCGSLTSIGDSAFYGCGALSSVDLSGCGSLTSIGDSVFSDCDALGSVDLPSSLTSIGYYAFSDCDALEEIRFRGNLPNIGSGAFSGVEAVAYYPDGDASYANLKTDTYGETIAWISDKYYEETHTDAVAKGPCGPSLAWMLDSDGVLTISGEGRMKDYDSYPGAPWDSQRDKITSVVLPAGLISIGDYAFRNCDALSSVDLSGCGSLSSIGDSAFRDCDALGSVDLSGCGSLSSIGNFAFYGCGALSSVDLSGCGSLTSIGDSAFYDCDALSSVDLSGCGSLTSIGDSAFYGCGALSSVDLSGCGSLTSIGDAVFSDCAALGSVDLPSSLISIGSYAFRGCAALGSLDLPSSLSSIGNFAFYGCGALSSVDLSGCGSLSSIGDAVFRDCDALSSVDLPSSLSSIGSSAFSGCDALSRIHFRGSLPRIGTFAFSGVSAFAYFPEGDESYQAAPSYGGTLKWISDQDMSGVVAQGKCGETMTWQLTGDGQLRLLGNGEMTDAPWKDYCCGITSVSIMPGTTSIWDSAFRSCDHLPSISLPSSLTSIGDSAFRDCDALGSVDLSGCSNLSSIGSDAFCNCKMLSSVDLSGCGSLSSIGSSAFSGCDALGSVDLSGCGSLISIGDYVFRNCDALSSVDLSGCGSLSSIGDSAFRDCDALGSVDLSGCGSLSSIGNFAFYGCGALSSVDLSGCGSLTSIGDSAFYDCDALSSVDLSGCGSLTSIGDSAFYGCGALSSVDLSGCGSLTSIGDSVFYGCGALSSVDLSACSSLNSIGEEAFYDCNVLEAITIPASVTSIGSSAFASCDRLSEIRFEGKPESISYDAFAEVTANVSCRFEDSWNDADMKQFGGTLAWICDFGDPTEMEALTSGLYRWVNGDLELPEIRLQFTYESGFSGSIEYEKVPGLEIEEPDLSTVGRKSLKFRYADCVAEVPVYVHSESQEPVSDLPETAHPYGAADNAVKTVKEEGAQRLTLTFSAQTELAAGDTLHVMDKQGTQIAVYTGSEAAGATVTVTGDTAQLWLEMTGSGGSYGYKLDSVIAGAIKHEYQPTQTTLPTCTEPGGTEYACSICGETYTDPITATGHKWADAWDGDDGYHWHECENEHCTVTKDSEKDKYGPHDWDNGAETKPATFEAAGVKTYTCQTCKKTKTEQIPQKQHSYSEDWTYDADNHWHVCTDPGYGTLTTEKQPHDWDEGRITTAPTFEDDGVKTYTCQTCQKTKTEQIPQKQHSYSEDWTHDADNHWHVCTDPGYGTLTTEKQPHDWDNGRITTDPTYEREGVKTYTCQTCQATKTESVPKLEHHFSEDWTHDQTHHWHECTDAGCNEVKDRDVHDWDEGAETKPATFEAAGVKTYTCQTCKYTRTEPIPQLVHSYSEDWTHDADNHWHVCTDPGYDTLTTEKQPHDWDEGRITTAPTFEDDGVKTYTCQTCQATKTESVPSLKHHFSEDWTHDADNHWHECTDADCDRIADKAAHIWDGGKVTTEPTQTQDGVKTYICTVCGAQKTEAIPATGTVQPPVTFTDVPAGMWYAEPVAWAVEKGITNGMSDTLFKPDNNCTRAQIVTFLWRANGSPEPTSTVNPFVDVPESQYYYKAVLWAVEKNITTGIDQAHFKPDNICKRGQAVTFQWRAAGKPTPTSSENPFVDVPAEQFYHDAVLWAVERNITTGTTATTFKPDNTCTRGHIVTFLYRDLVK